MKANELTLCYSKLRDRQKKGQSFMPSLGWVIVRRTRQKSAKP